MYECFDCRVTFRDQFPDDPDGPQYCQACGSERLIPRDDLEILEQLEQLEESTRAARAVLRLDHAYRRDEARRRQ